MVAHSRGSLRGGLRGGLRGSLRGGLRGSTIDDPDKHVGSGWFFIFTRACDGLTTHPFLSLCMAFGLHK